MLILVFMQFYHYTSRCGFCWFLLVHQVRPSKTPGRVREEREVNMGSSSSSYAPKSIYLDVDGKVQKVNPILREKRVFTPI